MEQNKNKIYNWTDGYLIKELINKTKKRNCFLFSSNRKFV